MKYILCISFLFFFCKSFGTRFYFNSVTGLDTRTNIEAQDPSTPWKTVAKLNSQFSSLQPGDSVLFNRGQTFIADAPILVTKSGSSSKPIVISAYGIGARPIITGLVSITWESLGSNLYRMDETTRTDFASVSDVRMVTKNGLPIAMGRWPNVDNGWGGYNTMEDPTTSTSFFQKTGSELDGEPSFKTGAEVVYKATRFWIERYTISSWNQSTHKITFTKSDSRTDNYPQNGWGYFIQNDSDILETAPYQNAWYYRPNKYLKIYSSGTPTNISAAKLTNLFKGPNHQYITVDNIDFNGCSSDAVILSGTGGHYVFTNCIIRNVGRNAINMQTPYLTCIDDSIVNCQSKGIAVTDANATNLTVTSSTFRNFGQFTGMGNGSTEDGNSNHSGVAIYVVAENADNVSIQQNDVHLCGYNGIHIKRQNNVLINQNYVDSVNNITDDGGGIYGYSEGTTNSNRVISNNIVFHGIGNTQGRVVSSNPGAGVHGIYGDRDFDHCLITGNTVSKFQNGIFMSYGNHDITTTNNTLVDNSVSQLQINTRSSDHTRNLTVTGNLCLAYTTSEYCNTLVNNTGDVLTSFGTINNNYYIKPLSATTTNTLLKGQDPYPSSQLYCLSCTPLSSSWTGHFGYDAGSHLSPYFYTSTTQMVLNTLFATNASNNPSIIIVSGTYKDIQGTTYSGSITIPAWGSLFLFKVIIPPTIQTIKLPRVHLIPN